MKSLRARCGRAAAAFVAVAALVAAATPTAAAADRTKPTTPTNLRVTATAPTSVSLAWNPSTDNSGSFTYTVRELNSWQTRTLPQTQTSYAWTGLTPSKTYRFLVYARDGSGNQSSNSNTVTATTPAAPPPTTPANLRVAGATLFSVTLAWDASPGAASYQVSRGTSIYGTTQTTISITGLEPGSTHTFAVKSTNASGQSSPWSAPLVASTLVDTQAPTVPVASATALGPGRVQVTWTASTDDLSWVGYNVEVDGRPARSMLPEPAPRTVVIHNLRAATTYTVTVRAYDVSGNFSAPSAAVVLTTPTGTDTTPPAAPPNLQQSGPAGPSSVDLGWGWSVDDVGTTAFEIYMDGQLVAENLYDVHYPGVNTWATIRRVPPGTTHTFTVRARDEAGNVSAASNPVTVTFPPSTDTVAPSAPVLTWASNWGGCAFVDFMWSVSDDVDNPGQLDIEIYEDGYSIGFWRGEVHEASFGRHSYTLRAVDRAGNISAPSNAIALDNGLEC
jgi:chitodextrinase